MTICPDCNKELDDKKGYCYEYEGKEYHYCFNCEREKELEK